MDKGGVVTDQADRVEADMSTCENVALFAKV